ncbi:hypothetical protein BDM02DRAFT_3098174 [Thelephora ganbajun]|uniref:Uncharacterized protein n=1 Tax=Thelephora ganbajun TaxID=370292 RepID=A0ACB6ZE42_THEGA|nr:hypothetical protein BDM02DRAFT_3098174 [Thelephora ganbajun]
MVPIDRSPLPSQSFPDHFAPGRSRSQSILIDDWTPEFQREPEERIARLTVSAGLPLSWVDDPAWINFVNGFLPSARSPSQEVLTNRLIPVAAKRHQDAIRVAVKNQNVTLQVGGWTDTNSHHLLAFTVAFQKQFHTVNVHDASSERKTAEDFTMHLENAIRAVQADYFAFPIAVVTNASGECCKARRVLAPRYPDTVFLDCYAHQFADHATELITWLRSKTQVLAVLRRVQEVLGVSVTKAVIHAVLARWTAHYQAYSRLLDLRSVLLAVVGMDEYRLEKERFVVAGDAKAREKAKEMVMLIRNDAFWKALHRMKLHLQPLGIATNVTQAPLCRLDTVLLIFGFLVMKYQQMVDNDDRAAPTAIISSLEKRWMAADQDIFIATVIVNPFFRIDPFGPHIRFVVAEVIGLLQRLYARFFREEAPHSFSTELRDYLWAEGQYSELHATCLRHKIIAQGQDEPLEIYQDLSFSSKPHSPFHRLAAHLLSICANSTSCERLFSTFENTLTEPQNRTGTSTLSSIAELKMHVLNEHRLSSTKTRMKHMFAARSKTASAEEVSTLSTVAQPPSPQSGLLAGGEATSPSIDEDPDHACRLKSGLRDFVSDHCSAPIDDGDDDDPVAYPSRGGKLSLSQLFNFENDHWVKLYEECAKRSYEEELALCDLLNEDAETSDGVEVDVDEMTAEILMG